MGTRAEVGRACAETQGTGGKAKGLLGPREPESKWEQGPWSLTFAMGGGRAQGARPALSESLPGGVPGAERLRASPHRESRAEFPPPPPCQSLIPKAEGALGPAHGCRGKGSCKGIGRQGVELCREGLGRAEGRAG